MRLIVPLLQGAGQLSETGAGGSAPKHVRQLAGEGHLALGSRLWEYCGAGAIAELMATKGGNPRAAIRSKTLDEAIGQHRRRLLPFAEGERDRQPFVLAYYLALAWAKAPAARDDEDGGFKATLHSSAAALAAKEGRTTQELLAAQGKPVDIGGYYFRTSDKWAAAIGLSATPTLPSRRPKW